MEPERLAEELSLQESRIAPTCLKHNPKEFPTRADEDQRDLQFIETVAGVNAIVKEKLYRAKAKSLEAYFNASWNISRAQVYRYIDCATVLDALQGVQEIPNRERLCRSIKRLAKTPQDIRELWERVLVNTSVRPIPTLSVDAAWDDLKASRRGEGHSSTITPKPTKKSGKGNGQKKTLRKEPLESSSESAISWDSQDENLEVAPPIPEWAIPLQSSKKRKPGRPRKRANAQNIFRDMTNQQESMDHSDDEEEDSLNDKVQFITTPRKRSRSDLHPFNGSGLVSSTDSMAVLHRRAFSSDTTPRSTASLRGLPGKNASTWASDREPISPFSDQLQSPREMQVEYHVSHLFSSMDALQQLGYCLQPSIHGRWFTTHVRDWRMMPMSQRMEDPFMIVSQAPVSPDASQPPLSSSTGSLFSHDLLPSPKPISTLAAGPPTEDVQNAAMDLCNLLANNAPTFDS